MYKKNRKKRKNKKVYQPMRRGFSMAEVMISVFILSLTIPVIFMLMAGSIRHSNEARDQIIASQLAQGGIELVKNIRDNNLAKIIAGNPDINVFDNLPTTSSNTCRIAQGMDKIDEYGDCQSKPNDKILYINSYGFYVHNVSGSTKTKFKRRIKLEYENYNLSNSDYLTVTSQVSWKAVSPWLSDCNLANQCVEIKTKLYKTQDDS